MKYSMMKTFAAKYRTGTKEIKKRYLKNGDFTVAYDTKGGSKEAVYYNQGFRRQEKPLFGQVDMLEIYKKYDRPNSLAAKLRAKVCELCGEPCNKVEIHQVKSLKSLTGHRLWEIVMRERRRKTIAVCPSCHNEIHSNDKIVS
jgi:hypothetical protein